MGSWTGSVYSAMSRSFWMTRPASERKGQWAPTPLRYSFVSVMLSVLVTISTDNITETNEYRSGVGAHWPFLSDAGRVIQKDLDIAEYTDPVHDPMIPHTIVLEPGLVIYKVYNGYWFF